MIAATGFGEILSRKMTLATDIVVILPLILVACRPKSRLLLSAAKMCVVMAPPLWLLIVAIFGLLVASQLAYILGQALRTLLILAIFAGVGLRTRRSRA
jgi:hypothetical protein